MAKYEEIDRGQIEYGVYRKKPTNWGGIVGGIIVLLIVTLVIANL